MFFAEAQIAPSVFSLNILRRLERDPAVIILAVWRVESCGISAPFSVTNPPVSLSPRPTAVHGDTVSRPSFLEARGYRGPARDLRAPWQETYVIALSP